MISLYVICVAILFASLAHGFPSWMESLRGEDASALSRRRLLQLGNDSRTEVDETKLRNDSRSDQVSTPSPRSPHQEISFFALSILNNTYTLPSADSDSPNIHSNMNFFFELPSDFTKSAILQLETRISMASCAEDPESIVRSLVTSANGVRTAITSTCLRGRRQARGRVHGSFMDDGRKSIDDDQDDDESDDKWAKAASAVVCPINARADRLWIDAVGTPGAVFNIHIEARFNNIKVGHPKQVTISGVGRDHGVDGDDSFTEIFTFELDHVTAGSQIMLAFSSSMEDNVPAEFTLMKDCYDGSSGAKNEERRKIRGLRYAARMKMTARRVGTMFLSPATHPRIKAGKWYIGVTLLNPKGFWRRINSSDANATLALNRQRRQGVILTKSLTIHIRDDSEAFRIWPIFAMASISCVGVLAPLLYYRLLTQVEIKLGAKLGRAWISVICNWLLKGHKTFSYTTVLFGVTLAIGAFQMVQENWYKMLVAGDRDLCYYNERCYVTNLIYDYPFNLISSNICYVIHGVIVGLSLSVREAYCFSEGHVLYYDFSLGYALAWALIFEGVFSSIYHLCPTRLIFQFDTNFMYLIGALTITCVFHGNSITQQTLLLLQRYSHLTEDVKKALNLLASQKSLHHTKIFLFFAAPILTFNYLGSIKEVSGFGPVLQVLFALFVIGWAVMILIWSGCKLDILPDCFGLWRPKIIAVELNQYGVFYKDADIREIYEPRKSKFSFFVVGLYLLYTFGLLYFLLAHLMVGKGDISQLFLLICVGTGFIAMVTGEYRECLTYQKWKILRLGSLVAYYLVIFAFWSAALYFFKAKSMTQKKKKPYESRESNFPCILFGFYDYHDIWHLLSSFALLLTSYRVILLSHPCKMCQFSYIRSMITGSRDIEIKVDVIGPTPQPSPQPMKRSDTLEDIPETDEAEEDEDEENKSIKEAIVSSNNLVVSPVSGTNGRIPCEVNGNVGGDKSPNGKCQKGKDLDANLLSPPCVNAAMMLPENRLILDERLKHLASSEDISDAEFVADHVNAEVETSKTVSEDISRNDNSTGGINISVPAISTPAITTNPAPAEPTTLLVPKLLEVPASSSKNFRRKRKEKYSPPSSRSSEGGAGTSGSGSIKRPGSEHCRPPLKFYILRP